ncbi:MAG: hypothetical protein Q7J48_10200 [Nocardioides sp.]|jgi:hypothetical protein|uniref:DUF222 domain-containing protein n=1 Tax=Nocardioides aquaticus TaxID=160826 RepID=A0ABX8EJ94_9ACTN|nr:hypothetical protein [Nocardioides aquaticus]MDO9496064.1 hypothetical protein [Nocardioides sp.]QVT80593.1 hypothetical protein ENKNEFLB_02992 [Nocardioides aquaticus]
MTTDTTLSAAEAMFEAEQAVSRARWVVEELQETITCALRVLDDAELDSAKAKLSERGSFYLEAAGEHLGRLRTRCNDILEFTHDLFVHLNRASQSVTDARTLLDLADTSDPVVASEVAQLKPRIAVVGEMVALAKPVAQLAAKHVETAHLASRDVTALGLLEPVSLERSTAIAGKELGRADEDVRLLGNVVDRAAASARESASIASEITDNARRRMSEQSRDPITSASLPAPRSPGR